MIYLTHKLHQAGLTANTPKTVLEQALLIDSGLALETAVNMALTGISWSLQMAHTPPEEIRRVIRAMIKHELFQKAIQRRKAIMYEAV